MTALVKKEFMLCLHPTCIIFLCFCLMVFAPNYPYEVIFFFSCLSVFFYCMTARENGDLAFTCALPVHKGRVAVARIVTVAALQTAILAAVAVTSAIKSALLPREMLINMAGVSANMTLLAHGGLILGSFNLIFFPLYFKKPDRIGIPFVIAVGVAFILIALFVTLRFALPHYGILNGPDCENTGAKAIALAVGVAAYCAMTAASCKLCAKIFAKTDL